MSIDLCTFVVDWEEFRDLQLAFLKASVANCEVPTDHGITALLFRMAHKIGTRYILSGSNLVTEAIMPLSWGHYNQDLKHLKALHERFGTRPLKTMPTINLLQYMHYVLMRGIRQIPFLNYIHYNREETKRMLVREFGWRNYGGKHSESIWTRFFQGYYLPQKFGYDKRRAHLSSLICSGQMNREEALATLQHPPYTPSLLREDMQFVLKKLGLTDEDLSEILRRSPKVAQFYPGHHFLFYNLIYCKNAFRWIATRP